MKKILWVGIVFLSLAKSSFAGDWPAWRGPQGNGVVAANNVPETWDKQTNVRWKIKLPRGGNSTPIVWKDRIFLTQCLDVKGHKRALMCLDRANGNLLWQKDVAYHPVEPTHSTNPYCSASPITDGERVIVSFGSAGMFCYDLLGKQLWKVDLGKLDHIWGNASSPILYKDLAILWCGPGDRQFLLAVDKKTGKERWRFEEPGGSEGKDRDGASWLGSWCTPILVQANGKTELVVSVPHKVKGFDPDTGKQLWFCDGLGPLVYTSPLISADGILVVMSGYGGPAMAVKTGGKGDVTNTHRLWVNAKPANPQRIGTGVIHGKYLFMVSEPGVPQCFDVRTGEELWKQKRLPEAQTWSSLVLVDEKIYCLTQNGNILILSASPKFQLLGSNALGELTRASPVILDGEILIRTYQHLWCIGKKR